MNNVVTTQISIQLSQELNSLLNAIVEENNTTKTDFIRQAVIEKIEDTSLTLLDLKKEGFSKNIIEAVDILTKKKGQDYQSYLNLVKTNELARVVKLADLRHNSDLTRLPLITEKDLERNKKYSSAIRFLRTKKKS